MLSQMMVIEKPQSHSERLRDSWEFPISITILECVFLTHTLRIGFREGNMPADYESTGDDSAYPRRACWLARQGLLLALSTGGRGISPTCPLWITAGAGPTDGEAHDERCREHSQG